MVDKLYHRANPHSSFRPTVCLDVEIWRFVCDRATPPITEKFGPKELLCMSYAEVPMNAYPGYYCSIMWNHFCCYYIILCNITAAQLCIP